MYDELVKQCRDCIDCLCGDCKYEHLQKPGNFVQCMNSLLGETADAIEELTHENESLAKSVNEASEILRKRWVSVTEALPDVDEKVLTFARNKYDGSWFMDITSWTGVRNHDEYHFWGYGDSMKVTHWMPLPEPPKEV